MLRVNSNSLWMHNNSLKTFMARNGSQENIFAGNNIPLSPFSTVSDDEIDYILLKEHTENILKNRVFISDVDKKTCIQILDDYLKTFKGKEKSIGDKRINDGFNSGLIDFGIGAYIKNENGWFDHKNKKVADINTSLKEMKDLISKIIKIIPVITFEDLKKADETGVFEINGFIIAKKNDESLWEFKRGEKIIKLSGDSIRVLHHSDFEAIIPIELTPLKLYHGVTKAKTERVDTSFNGFKSYGLSRQGDGFYMTTKEEVVDVYSNPKSAERISHKIELFEKHGIAKADDYVGVIHECELTNKAIIWNCSHDTERFINNVDNKPSLCSIMAIMNNYGDNLDEKMKNIITFKSMAMMNNAITGFDVYMAVNEMQNYLFRESDKDCRKILGQVTQSLGFDGILIKPPSIKDVSTILILENDEYSNIIKNNMRSYMLKVKDNTPAYLKELHVVLFNTDPSLCKVKKGLINDKNDKLIESFLNEKKGINKNKPKKGISNE